MKKSIIILSLIIACASAAPVNAQQRYVDTIGIFPHLYYYHFPEIGISHDGYSCFPWYYGYDVGILSEDDDWNLPHEKERILEIALLQHTDDTLYPKGLAFGITTVLGGNDFKLTLYDSTMQEIASCTRHVNNENWGCWDSLDNAFFLVYPNAYPLWRIERADVVCYAYFNDTVFKDVAVHGDYYIGFRRLGNDSIYYETNIYMSPLCIDEHHRQPWNYPSNTIRLDSLGHWLPPYTSPHALPVLFLLIDPLCDSVTGITMRSNEGCFKISWDSVGRQTRWQVRIIPEATPYNYMTIYRTVDSTHLDYWGLDSGANYYVNVRAYCDYSGTWSDWSDSLFFHNTWEHNGIDCVDAVAVEIGPNPTMGALTVSCEAAIEEIELYDVQGRCALSSKANGTSAVLDLTELPSGSYVLVAHTDKGLATRTVEKR